MVATKLVVSGLAAAAYVSASYNEDHFFATLKKRQEPGTPAYNCHDNCGLAITLSRESDPCDNTRFQSAYANCIQCSGPDNYNIWRYYGGSLSNVGESCGLPTTPKDGKQPDVPPAGSSGMPGSSSASANPSPSPTASPEETPESSGVPVPSTDGPAPTSEPPESSGAPGTATPASSASVTGGASGTDSPVEFPPLSSIGSSVSDSLLPTITPSISGAPNSGNATASFTASAPPEQSLNAAPGLDVNAGVFGAIVIGIMYGLGN